MEAGRIRRLAFKIRRVLFSYTVGEKGSATNPLQSSDFYSANVLLLILRDCVWKNSFFLYIKGIILPN